MTDAAWGLLATMVGTALALLLGLRFLAPRGFTTFKRELGSFLFQPIGWIILVLLYLVRGYEVASLLQRAVFLPIDRDQFAALYLQTSSSSLMLILVPAILTMRCFAEERRTGSLEVLLTAPVKDHEVVLGKWAAALGFFVLLWLPGAVVLPILATGGYLDTQLNMASVLSGYLGIFLVGSLLLAAGCFASSLTDNQLLASLLSMMFAFGLLAGPGYLQPYLAPGSGSFLEAGASDGGEVVASAYDDLVVWLRDTVLVPVLRQVNIADHLGNWFFRGVLNTSHIVFYIGGSAFFLFLTTRSLEARRWK